MKFSVNNLIVIMNGWHSNTTIIILTGLSMDAVETGELADHQAPYFIECLHSLATTGEHQ